MKRVKVGDMFGELIVLEETKKNRKNKGFVKAWKCLCSCGNFSVCETNTLTSGHSQSCGCKRLESISSSYKDITGTWYGQIKRNAKNRGFSFNITQEELQKIIDKQNHKCAISGIPIAISKKRSGKDYYIETTASLDRINNELGYEINNVQFVHKHINYMKWTHNQNYFIELCKKVVENVSSREFHKKTT